MAIKALELMEMIRWRLDDQGGDTGTVPEGYYTYWQYDDADCLWKNRELMLYLAQTIREINTRAPIKDGADRTIALSTGTRLYELDEDIVRVVTVTRASDGNPLVKATVAEMEAVARWHRHRREELALDWRTERDSDETGWPTHYLLDEQHYHLSVYPLPDADHQDTLRLTVWMSYPAPPTWAKISHEATPSRTLDMIPDDFDEALMAGVCARAYRKRDSDTRNDALVKRYEDEFTGIIGPPLSQRQLDTEARWTDMPLTVEPNTFYAR
jgi:hypothetical protein